MKISPRTCLLLSVLATVSIRSAQPATVVSLTGTAATAPSFSGSPLATSWSSSVAFNNVSITAALQNLFGTSYTATAWLTSKIGPGATAANVVASTTFMVHPPGNSIQSSITLFSGLHLDPGTYYLVLMAPAGTAAADAAWVSTDTLSSPSPKPVITTAPSVTYVGVRTTNGPLNSFPPATSFGGPYASVLNLIFSVTGTPAPTSIIPNGVVPIYSTTTTIEPGSWISIYGVNLATDTFVWNGDFPMSLGGTSVTINNKPAYLWLASPTQINAEAPDDTATGPVSVVVTSPNGTASATVILSQFGPSFSLLDVYHVAGILLRSDRSGAYGGGTYDIVGPTGSSLGYKTVAARSGDTLVLFGVGFGPTSPPTPAGKALSGAAPTMNPVQLSINGISVTPDFAGITSTGLYQINILKLPAGLGTGDVPLVARVGGVTSQTGVALAVQ